MTPYEKNLFADLLNGVETDLPSLAPTEQNNLYQLILTRSGIAAQAAQKRRTAKRVWLVAAILAGLTLLAAGFYSVRDVFHGVLAEPAPVTVSAQASSPPATSAAQADTPQLQPVDQTAALVEQAGVLAMQSATADGLTVTLQAAIFDEMSTRLIVEVASEDGSSLAAKHERIAQRFGHHIKQARLVVDGLEHPLDFSCNRLDHTDDGKDGTVRFLLDGDGLPASAQGKTAKLVLSEFVEEVEFELKTDPATAKGEMSLGALAAQLGEPDMSQFEVSAVTKRDGSLARNDYSRDQPPAKQGILFSSLFPDTYVDTIFVKDSSLWLFGTGKDPDTVESLHSLEVKDMTTGKILQNSGGGSTDRQGMCQWSRRFDKVGDLNNLTLVRPSNGKSVLTADNTAPPPASDDLADLAGGDGSIALAKGPWEIPFTLDYQMFGRILQPKNETVLLRGYSYQVQEVRLSPFSAQFQLIPLSPRDPEAGKTRGWLDDACVGLNAAFVFKDGSSLPLHTFAFDRGDSSVLVQFSFTAVQNEQVRQMVVDPQTVTEIRFGEQTILLPS